MNARDIADVANQARRRENELANTPEEFLARPYPLSLKEDDVFTAWEILSPAGNSALTKHQVLESLRMFFPHISAREVKDLIGPGNLSADKLRTLLFHTDVPSFDPNVEAFKILDPHGTGYVDGHVLGRLLQMLPGMQYMDGDDLDLLMAIFDSDGDGVISLRDFATIGSWAPPREVATEAVHKLMLEKLRREQQG